MASSPEVKRKKKFSKREVLVKLEQNEKGKGRESTLDLCASMLALSLWDLALYHTPARKVEHGVPRQGTQATTGPPTTVKKKNLL